MSGKQNCWEYNKCGREPSGINTAKLGICPATTNTSANGFNGGKNGGRICWTIAFTCVQLHFLGVCRVKHMTYRLKSGRGNSAVRPRSLREV